MITLVAAHDDQWGIGLNAGLPWPPCKEDFDHFKRETVGHTVLMGRKTFESIGKPLPNRTSVVITRSPTWFYPGCFIYSDLESALRAHKHTDRLCVIGGADIYKQALPFAHCLLLTHIEGSYECDTFWQPDLDNWSLTKRDYVVKDDLPICSFSRYDRSFPDRYI